MRELSRQDLLRFGAGLGLADIAPQVLSAAGRMRFSKYEIFSTRIPMAERVREAWIASYKPQGTFQTHYNPCSCGSIRTKVWLGSANLSPASRKPRAS